MYDHIVSAFFAEPWAITSNKYQQLRALLALRVAGQHVSAEEIAAVTGAAALREEALRQGQGSAGGAVAVLPLYGVIAPRANMMTESSGGTSVQAFTKAFRQALNDPGVASIVIDVDSPGGQVAGIEELATEIRAARGRKPIVAVANTLAASAAYWIAAQADELVVSPSADVGSLGVFMEHWDDSKALEAIGSTPTLIFAGKNKVEGNPYEPLSDEARAYFQAHVDQSYAAFVNAVAKGRGVSASVARSERFGQGRVYGAAEAVERGMADRMGTLDDAIARAASGKVASRGARSVFTGEGLLVVGGRADAGISIKGVELDTTEGPPSGWLPEIDEDPVTTERVYDPAAKAGMDLAAARLRLAEAT